MTFDFENGFRITVVNQGETFKAWVRRPKYPYKSYKITPTSALFSKINVYDVVVIANRVAKLDNNSNLKMEDLSPTVNPPDAKEIFEVNILMEHINGL